MEAKLARAEARNPRMNFVFHHHLALRDLASPLAGVGAMLPDLWRMADRRVHALPRAGADAAFEGATGATREVLAGICHHIAVDAWFHAAPVFRDGERAAAAAIRAAAPNAPRIGLFAHPLWEICLDGALLHNAGADHVVSALRHSLAVARESAAMGEAAEVHHFRRIARDQAAREAFARRLEKLESAITDGPWVSGYANGAGIVDRLDGMRARFEFPPIEGPERAALAKALDGLLAIAAEPVRALLACGTFSPAPSPQSCRAC